MDGDETLVAGVDGCKNGWVVVSQKADAQPAIQIVSQFANLVRDRYSLIVVDIPIGLLDQGTRLADCAARRALKGRACCVFTAPLRPMLACQDYAKGKEVRRQIDGKGLTKQAWAIVPKIAEVDRSITPESQSRIKEGHPEVSFTQMNGGEPVLESKHTMEGRQARIRLLTAYFPNILSVLQQHSRMAEDVIDAFAMLWTARRICKREGSKLPAESQKDSRGLLMEIWA
ncbi:MAG TPA: DUF429 domain-containing protein [Candidatus Angelobacter sp.]